ncbi:MAG TPA: protein kinase [Gemmatimonadales bacterium]|jgi:serine/threonine-protein kinase|nr:protein kinase [Gemmatimonadales bacterium]
MTNAPPRCAACHGPLGTDDLFCPHCGTPTPLNVDPNATLVNPAGTEESTAGVQESPPPRSSTAFNDQLRQVLGAEYELISLLGQGGFARVFQARDRRLDRKVAIKVIRPDLMGKQDFLGRFRNEGIALAKLRHPGIVPIFDIRERGGMIYYIMPFVEGTTLDARMNRARLPPFESRRILSELADALAAAHRAQMVHLDIKPANVFLEGDRQKVLLMDFGIAIGLTKPAEESSSGRVIGTPEYMSPEQARGLPDIDHRSDIYSLGALGYRMLTGRPPFRGRTAADTLEQHMNRAPMPLRDVNPTIPKELADAIMRCLQKDPADRFANALDLRGTLDSVTFFSAGETPGRVASGLSGTLVALLAALALLIGLVIGQALR